ncbi:MAG: ABC transporter permease [Sorangium cellulosum]|nr:MAG: ABC transporter permease [Sorangium cellulosum]
MRVRGWILELRTPLTAVATAIVVLNLLSWGFGEAPLSTLLAAAAGSWGTVYGIGQVLFKATPLLLAGVAVDLALRAGLFNIGVEGQIAIASLAGTMVAVALPEWLPSVAAVPITLVAAASTGALWAGISGWMKARFNAHEVITTIMLNRIAGALVAMAMTTWLALPGTVRTADVVQGAKLPQLDHLLSALSGSAVSWAFPASVVVLFATYLWLRHAPVGRELVWVGSNEKACAAEGIPVARRKVLAMGLSGAIGSLAMASTVLGYKGYYEIGLGAGVGFGGIAVAFLGRGRPIGLLLAALVFGTLAQAGLVINAQVPKEATGILEAVVIIAIALASRAATKDEVQRAAAKSEGTT